MTNVNPTLTLSGALTSVFKNYANFSGRARRSEYWWFLGFQLFLSIGCTLGQLGAMVSGEDYLMQVYTTMAVVVGLGLFLPSWAVLVRRLHDTNKSGWSVLWSIIPLIGIILMIVWTCQDSDVVSNKYGDSPKYNTSL